MPPWSLIQDGVLLLLLPNCFSTSSDVWFPVYWMNSTPWGALPSLARLTVTSPPVADFGASKLACCPFSLIFSDSGVGVGELSLLLPQPATSAAVAAVAATSANARLRMESI